MNINNILVVGYGSMGRRRIRLVKELLSEASFICVDSNPDRIKQAKEAGHEAVSSLDDGIALPPDIAFVCTSPGHHADIILPLLSAGIHVFTELNLTSDRYDEMKKVAREHSAVLFISSTLVYKRQMEMVKCYVEKQNKPVTYIYHVGQYLPDWHPWESYKDFFVGKKETNGIREILAIQLPWMVRTFGGIADIHVLQQNCTSLEIDYPDAVVLNVKHESGNIGTFVVDVTSRRATTYLEVIGEDIHILWNGHNDDFYVYDFDKKMFENQDIYESENHVEGYADVIAEEPYSEEVKEFLNTIGGKSPIYGIEEDAYVLNIIDKIESKYHDAGDAEFIDDGIRDIIIGKDEGEFNPLHHSGYINLRDGKHYSYEFDNGEFIFHAYDSISELNGNNFILGVEHKKNIQCLYLSQLPLNFDDFAIFPSNYRLRVDAVIKKYQPGSRFFEARFCFDELQYFKPSLNVIGNTDDEITFSRYQKELLSFDVVVANVECTVSFVTGAKGTQSLAHSNMEAVSEIVISFPETDDFAFLHHIYNLVDCVFDFICNRRNTTCTSMELRGEYDTKGLVDGRIKDRKSTCISQMYFINRYREEPETRKIIEKTFDVAGFTKHIDRLFQLIAEDLTSDNSTGNISIASIHPSFKRRNLIDLQQSLQITGAFEFYVRRYLPVIVEEKTYHTVIKMVLDDFARCPIVTGKAKSRIKDLAKNVVREPALEDKIKKAYAGFENWRSLKPCISNEWFDESEIDELAREANRWRNELAHEKRSYEPNLTTIRAVRFLEHLNYAIVLRELGYDDWEIKDLLRHALIRM